MALGQPTLLIPQVIPLITKVGPGVKSTSNSSHLLTYIEFACDGLMKDFFIEEEMFNNYG